MNTRTDTLPLAAARVAGRRRTSSSGIRGVVALGTRGPRGFVHIDA
ncbi:MAG: hypothetical protein K0Q76_3334 [Panacagrimonas sp.]|nr:hypothetical protein [Panacagrimonas sp.]MCC2658226.1 hypothetical protein [Panacagrimonas sp.]